MKRTKLIGILVLGAANIILGALSVVVPGRDEAVVAVSRFGSKVSLLPDRPSLSLLPLARRHIIDRRDSAAWISFPAVLTVGNGRQKLESQLDIVLEGSGALPVDAATVKDRGWEEAWAAWAVPKLRLSDAEAEQLITATNQWQEIFPETAEVSELDFGDRFGETFAAFSSVKVAVDAGADPAAVRAAAALSLGRDRQTEGRLIVLGLDALTWRILDELVGRGAMPNLARILDRGVQAEVIVRPPLLSPLIWTSIATGVHPEVHGVLDFIEPNPDGGEPLPISSAARKVPALWEIAAAAGRTTSVIGWWATFPAFAPPGATVYSDRLTEQIFDSDTAAEGVAAPAEAAEVAHSLEVHRADLNPQILAPILEVSAREIAEVPADSTAWDEPIGGLLRLMSATLTTERLTGYELDRGTEIVMTYLEGTDTVGHLFAPHRPPALPIVDREAARRFGRVVDRYYTYVDGWIGRVVAELDERDTLVIVSDHGFRWFEDRPLVAAGAHTATAENWHRKEGVFIAMGPGIQRSRTRHNMELLDVAASLFVLAGLPQGLGMPGTVHDWIFEGPRPVAERAVNYAELLPIESLRGSAPRTALAPEVRDEQLAKLRALGYIAGEADQPAAAPAQGHDRLTARRLHNLGLRYTDAGDNREAEESYRGAIAADPTYVPTHFAFAFLLRSTGRYDEADRELWQAIDLDPNDKEDALIRVAQHYRRLGQLGRAGDVLMQARLRYPDSAKIWLDLGAIVGEQGDIATSRSCLERAIELDPRDPFAYRNLAAVQVATGDLQGAQRSLTRALELDPGNEEVRGQLQALGAPER